MKKVVIIFSVIASICAAIAGAFAYLSYRKKKRYASLSGFLADAVREKIKNGDTISMDELEALCE